jgi:hypothetical protein
MNNRISQLKPGDLVEYYGSEMLSFFKPPKQRDRNYALIKRIESNDYIRVHWINGNPYWDNVFDMSCYYEGEPEGNLHWFWRKVQ